MPFILCAILLLAAIATRAEDPALGDTLSPDRARRAAAYALLAEQRRSQGDSEGGLRALQQAMQADPNDAAAYYRLAIALRDYGAVPMAVRALRSYIRLEADPQKIARAQDLIRSSGFAPPPAPAQALAAADYIGPAACGECHRDRFAGFRQTAHYLTSRPADEAHIDGSFAGDEAFLWTRDPNLWFEMSARPDGFYQTASTLDGYQLSERSERFDLVVGSGKIGQSYLYWRGDRLFQLPVSHYAETGQWINSPGFPDGEAFFERPIGPRCLECHATHFQSLEYGVNIHGRTAAILGVTCERCHGPGAAHAANQRSQAPDDATIVHPARLDPADVIDLCGQCHSDTGSPLQAPFSFRPGDALADFYGPPAADAAGGVHAANQVGRLAASRCFQQSEALTCITCHDPHALERGDTALFSSRCLDCHQVDNCGMEPQLGAAIGANCIDCHMPRRRDGSTRIQSPNALESPLMPDHRIAVYPQATRDFLSRR